ncbi:MAG TPA: hypothetical protein VGX21_18450 [Methylomirabilota bacterium]|nr:hypothetical protein [Methylomirabilota bacterium]
MTLTRVVRFRSETDPLIVRLRTQRGEPAYTRTEEHVAAGTITLTDDLGRWAFRYTRLDLSGAPTGINVVFLNQSPGSVHVDWNRTVFVDPTRRSRRLIHRGVKLTDREAATPASVVPAGAGLDDFVFPTDAIFFVSGRYGGWSASPVFERLRPGDSFTLVVGLQAGGQATERNFRFRVVPG